MNTSCWLYASLCALQSGSYLLALTHTSILLDVLPLLVLYLRRSIGAMMANKGFLGFGDRPEPMGAHISDCAARLSTQS